VVAVTMTAGYRKVVSPAREYRFLAHAAEPETELTRTLASRSMKSGRAACNDGVDALLTGVLHGWW